MRRAGFILTAALMTVPFTARAIQVETSLIATSRTGKTAVILSSASASMVVRTPATAALVKAKLTCLDVHTIDASIAIPPLPSTAAKANVVNAAGKAGGKWYYLKAISVGPLNDTKVQAVLNLGITTSSTSAGSCGAAFIHLVQAVGVATYV